MFVTDEAQAHNLPRQESGDSGEHAHNTKSFLFFGDSLAIESSEGRQSITSSLSPLLSPMGSLTATQLAPGKLLSGIWIPVCNLYIHSKWCMKISFAFYTPNKCFLLHSKNV